MISFQVENIEAFLAWVKTCPCEYTISSMAGGFIHVKFFIPMNKETDHVSNH
tara:strand:- start:1316 stop:1471 length:156 start_codon:yes stop_codon:yes gene_type:complete